jgi:tetratricopeptide (TPR) repeat protein
MDHLVARDSARAHLESALALNPGYSSAWYNLGNLAEQAGNRDEACRNFEKCLHADPANESALARLADAHKFVQRDDPLLNRLITTATNSRNSDVHFALGKAYEQAGEFGLAWDCFSKGNTLDDRLMPAYKPERVEARFRHIMSQTVRYSLDRDERQSNDPIFICGMFRSGSTLLEQVLAAHPRFVAGGESEFFPRLVARAFPDYPQGVDGVSLEKLAAWRDQHNARSEKLFGKSSRVTDKRPDNFLYVGLIKAVLPSARFVVMERDWRDVATSIYSVRLGPTQNYATNLRNIRHYIGQQTELVNYWESILGADLVRIRYEDVVHDAQKKITELLVWLGESWDAQCLSFHTLTNSVRTASVWQVREPLHENSVGRWKNYERQFADVFGNTPDD